MANWLDTVASEYAKQGQSMTQADKDYWSTNQNYGALTGAFAADKAKATSAPKTPTYSPATPSGGGGGSSGSTDYTKAIADAYKQYGGYAGEKAGVDWWSDYASTNANWLDAFQSELGGHKDSYSTQGLKGAQNLLGFDGSVWDNSQLTQDQKSKLILDSYEKYGFMAPDEKGFGNFMGGFDDLFSDYNLRNDWDNIFMDLEGRMNSMDLRGEQDVYKFATSIEDELAALMAQMGQGQGGGAGEGGAGGGGLNDYMNPYLQSVLNPALRELGDATTVRRNQLGSSAFGAGAYGDGRHGIESQGLTDDYLENVGDLTSRLFGQGYESAMGWKNTDLDRQMSAAFQNAGLENQWFNNQLNAVSTGSNVWNNAAGLGFSYADMLTGLDSYDRDWLQQQLNADYEDFWGNENWDANQLAQFLGVVSGVPGQTGSSQSTPNNMWASILGSLASDPDLIKSIGKGTLFGKIK